VGSLALAVISILITEDNMSDKCPSWLALVSCVRDYDCKRCDILEEYKAQMIHQCPCFTTLHACTEDGWCKDCATFKEFQTQGRRLTLV
jgi:hypothetical protein